MSTHSVVSMQSISSKASTVESDYPGSSPFSYRAGNTTEACTFRARDHFRIATAAFLLSILSALSILLG